MNDLPTWPGKLTREQQRSAKQRGKDFDAALKGAARETGWRFARGEVFRQSGDWFISIVPSLLWGRGAIVRMTIKPMALDPLFWNIVGLDENEALPLSFRATGAWVLRPPSIDDHVGLSTREVEQLASEVLRWGDQRTSKIVGTISLDTMLAELVKNEPLRGQHRALAACLHILAGDHETATRLCRVADTDAHPMLRDSGGFTTHNSDGSISTFFDQARDWIARKRRDDLSIV